MSQHPELLIQRGGTTCRRRFQLRGKRGGEKKREKKGSETSEEVLPMHKSGRKEVKLEANPVEPLRHCGASPSGTSRQAARKSGCRIQRYSPMHPAAKVLATITAQKGNSSFVRSEKTSSSP